ncbi:glycosyltransferase [Hyphomicrobium sp. CS1GBMeth3]|uniref:glycosyltransferase n=1 Tax=Hyphomicrobium sp. CS1GBMeth3 TaxID=1892845 RepID=UPI0009FA2792|nr:glycosyltransferase [Hyphomicrobium sp. CS1GBMeth3]
MAERIKSIGVMTPNYPSPRFIERGAFIEALVNQWQEEGVAVNVVAPISWPNWIRGLRRPRQSVAIAGDRVIAPHYPTFSARSVGGIDLGRLSEWSFNRAAVRASLKAPIADVYYGQFLFKGGTAAVRAGKALGRPAFADLGESRLLEGMSGEEQARAAAVVAGLAGAVCVSERLRDEAIALGAKPERVLLAPNRPDPRRFRPLDRRECRRTLKLPDDAVIVVFTGYFTERKGPLRVLAALERLEKPVLGVFLGRGPQAPSGARVLHAGPVSNSLVPLWLNAADLMMLPTLAEGHCNAIAEALACALPVITSDISDVRWQVPAEGSILVDPRDVGALASALAELVDDPERLARMRDKLRTRLADTSAQSRGRVILDWMNTVVAAGEGSAPKGR